MAEYVTKAELRSFSAELDGTTRERLRKASPNSTNATFLSHSSKDEDLVVGAARILTNHGATVYIDRIDPTLPPYTNKETASKLKVRIAQSKKFVLLASSNSKESKWVPWELGVADGEKTMRNIALFPAVEEKHDIAWTSWEYMGLYRRIVWGRMQGHDKPLWMVLDEEDNTADTLTDWLNR